MSRKRKLMLAMALALAVLFFVAMSCNDWDGMDRTGDAWASRTPEPTAIVDWHQEMPSAWRR